MRVRAPQSLSLLAAAVLVAAGTVLVAQSLPTTQPKVVQIYREHIKTGHNAAHRANESGWPEALAQAKSPDYYLAMESMTGSPEVWYVAPYESYTAWGKSMERDAANSTLTAATDRLSAADAEHLDGLDILEAVAAPALSYGAFPDLSKQRFWNITVWRIRPGHDADFVQAHAAYVKIAKAAAPNASWRSYRVTGGMPTGTYLTFSSVDSFGQFDRDMAESDAAQKAMTPQDQAMFAKFFAEGVISRVSNKYRLDASMSYVSPEARASDPAFWNKK
jgi:hypothetical protein